MPFTALVVGRERKDKNNIHYWGYIKHWTGKKDGIYTWKTYESDEFPGSERYLSKNDPVRVDKIPDGVFVSFIIRQLFVHKAYPLLESDQEQMQPHLIKDIYTSGGFYAL
ncbi:MAG TPA: hypothetical protein VE912_02115 [Bacteroidales bacterium]|nr:hypothetical protein [Bacteroidales bacterium]